MANRPMGIVDMKTALKTLSALGALTLIGVSPAKADYVIMQDSSFPSVVYFEFDEPVVVEPTVISAPTATPAATVAVIAPDPIVMSPSQSTAPTTFEPVTFNNNLIDNANKSPNEVAQQRIMDFEQSSGAELERAVEEAAIEDEVFSEIGLR